MDCLDERIGVDTIVIDFSKALDLGPHDRLLTELAVSDVYSRVDVWVKELFVVSTQVL